MSITQINGVMKKESEADFKGIDKALNG